MKRASVALGALIALSAATLAVADPTPLQTPADHPRQQQPNQATPPSDQSSGMNSERSHADTQRLVNVCIAQVQVSNPMAPVKDIKDFCDRQVKRTSPKD